MVLQELSIAAIAIHWFRNDLRLADNPSLVEAALRGGVVPVWFEDTELPRSQQGGKRHRWWVRRALWHLDRSLNGTLRGVRGDPTVLLPRLVTKYQAKVVSWNDVVDPAARARDLILQTKLRAAGAEVIIREATFLWDPNRVVSREGAAHQTFPSFYEHCLQMGPPRPPLPPPNLQLVPRSGEEAGPLALPEGDPPQAQWEAGEAAAQQALADFLRLQLTNEAKYHPADALPRLSPYFAHGTLSLSQAWAACATLSDNERVVEFRKNLIRREFCSYLLYHFPKMVKLPLRSEFSQFPWQNHPDWLAAWQAGQTGYPLIDASMRHLNAVGWLPGRLRQAVATFLTKHLLIDWRQGAEWFRDTLVDFATANNTHNWQSAASCTPDALPFYRFFNPVLQASKFDPNGTFLRRWLPELAHLPTPYLAAPWTAPREVLHAAKVQLGSDYPAPIIDLNESRQRALAALAQTTGITA